MGFFVSRSIGVPLGLLQRAAAEVGQGRFDVRVAIRRRDEIGMLAAQVNQMAADLKATTVSRTYLDNIICRCGDAHRGRSETGSPPRQPGGVPNSARPRTSLPAARSELFIPDDLPDSDNSKPCPLAWSVS